MLFQCVSVCVGLCVSEFLLPSMHRHGASFEEKRVTYDGDNTKNQDSKKQTREVNEENAATVTKHSTFPETRAGFELFSLKQLYE